MTTHLEAPPQCELCTDETSRCPKIQTLGMWMHMDHLPSMSQRRRVARV